MHDALAAPDLDALTELLSQTMPRLLDTEIGGYNEADPRRGRYVTRMNEPRSFTDGQMQVWAEHSLENPLVTQVLENPNDLGIHRITDYVDQHAFRKSPLCAELYAPLRGEYQMAMPFPVMDGAAVAMTFNRDVDYTERERDILRLAQPCLIAAYKNAQRLTDLRTGQQDLLAWLESTRAPIAVVTLRGRILGAAPGVLELINRFASDTGHRSGRLPEGILRWWRRAIAVPEPGIAGVGPLSLRHNDQVLHLTAIRASSGRNGLLAVQVSTVMNDQTGRPLNLTGREIEVFRAVGRGMNNKAIAAALGLSVRTVEKHVENLLNKLGVKSRTAACAMAATLFHSQLPGS